MSALPDPLITSSPDRLGGTPVFAGTRVPVQALVDYLKAGNALEVFLDDFPTVERRQAEAYLQASVAGLDELRSHARPA